MLRFAALMHDVGKPRTRAFEPGGGVSFHHHEVVGAKITRERMQALRFGNDVTDEVCALVELHLRFHGYGDGGWTDSAVRRYVRDAGDLLDRLLALTRADCTTRNRRRARAAAGDVRRPGGAHRAAAAQEELDAIRPDLDGEPRSWPCWGSPPGRSSGGPTASCSSSGWTAVRSMPARPSPSCWPGGRTSRSPARPSPPPDPDAIPAG